MRRTHHSTGGLTTACGWSVSSMQYDSGDLMHTGDTAEVTCERCLEAVVLEVEQALCDHDEHSRVMEKGLPRCYNCAKELWPEHVAIGRNATATGGNAIAIGRTATMTSVSIGRPLPSKETE